MSDRRPAGDLASEGFDLDPESRRVLQWDALLDWVSAFCRTPPGAAAVRRLSPDARVSAIRSELEAVEEVRRLHAEEGALLPAGLPDPAEGLGALGVEGLRLEPLLLRAVAGWLDAAAALRGRFHRGGKAEAARMETLARELPDMGPQAKKLLRSIEPDGSLSDAASPTLRDIRRRRSRTEERLRRQLEARLHEPASESVIQDAFVTRRNGRYVIPVRSDSPRPVRGIIHGSSSSGATQFVEPLDSVESNNEIVRLAEEEREEQERLLGEWSEALRQERAQILLAVEALALVDSREARARFAERTAARPPAFEEEGAFVLDQARHPLLERRLLERGESPVPLNLFLDPADGVLIVSGPNAGGKTVALKTIGLLLLMAHAGIPVPAREMRLPPYRQLRADIGDHQSIAADLSTYSAHVRSTVEFLRDYRPRGLILFDEIGTGTEPHEGAALAQAVLERLLDSGMTVVATTHLGALKRWSVASERVGCAAMEFDEKTLLPTFRLLQGSAGVSAGLPIAQRLGLEPGVIGRAESLLGSESLEGERYLSRLRALHAELEQAREQLAARGEAIEAEHRLSLAEAERREVQRGKDAGRALERELRDFRRRAGKAVQRIEDSAQRSDAEKRRARAERELAARRRVVERPSVRRDNAARGPVPESIRPGMRVLVSTLGQVGQVEECVGEEVTVRVGGMTVRVERRDLRSVDSTAHGDSPVPGRVSVRTSFSTADSSAAELELIGKTIDEGLRELDRFLDRAALAGHDEVRVVHGHGTGRLRQAVRRFLADHPHVRKHRPGRSGEGGDASTIVSLR